MRIRIYFKRKCENCKYYGVFSSTTGLCTDYQGEGTKLEGGKITNYLFKCNRHKFQTKFKKIQ